MRSTTQGCREGFTLVEIMVVLAVILLLTVISWPAIDRARSTSQTGACINNLREVAGAKDRYALENGKVTGDIVLETDIAPYFVKKYPICPASGVYTINPISTDPVCSRGPPHTF